MADRRLRPARAAVAALLTLAALVRVGTMFTGTLSGDDATVALVAKHILSGETFLPVFSCSDVAAPCSRGGVILGSLPAWLFYSFHGDPAAGSSGSVAQILRIDVDLSVSRLRDFLFDVVLRLLGTYYWEPDTAVRRTGLALNCVIYALGVGFLLVQLWRSRSYRSSDTRAWGLALLLLTLVASVGAVYFSGHALGDPSRYALPAYVPLLVGTGALIAAASRRSRALGAGLLMFLVLFGAWTHVRFLWPISPALRARESAARRARNTILEHLDARPVEALYVEDTMGAPLWAFLRDRPTVSAVARDVYVPSAVAADAAERIDILAARRARPIAADLAAIGATWTVTPIRGWRLFEDVRVPERAYRMVPRVDWRITGDARAPAAVADGDLFTAWPDPRPDGAAEPLLLDLGHVHRVARVIFWPSRPTSEVFPLRVSGSEDGRHWTMLGAIPAIAGHPTFVASGRPVFRPRNGWLELAMTPRPLRYLRVEPASDLDNAPWGIVELQVYEAAPEAPPARVGVDELVERLRAQGVGRLLTDPVASARVDRATRGAISTLIANGTVDNHGAAPPELLARPLRLRASDALLVPIEDVPELRQRLDAAGARHVAEPLGDRALVRVLAPLASTAPCHAPVRLMTTQEPAADGGTPRVSLEAALGEEASVSGMRLWNLAGPPWSPFPDPQIAVSRDGQVWETVDGGRAVPQWAWAGRTLFAAPAGLVEVAFDPVRARHVRLVIPSRVGNSRLLCVRHTPVAAR